MRYKVFLVWVPLALGSSFAAASDFNPLGFYIGGAAGPTRDTYTQFGISDETRTGWKAVAGLRPIRFFGAEVEYVDFGKTTVSAPVGFGGPIFGAFGGTAHARAMGVFGVGYLPIPIPYLSLYAKGGIERLHTTVDGLAACEPLQPPVTCLGFGLHVDQTESDFAYGGGAQVQVERLAFRAEYERTNSSVGHPNLLSFGVTWTF